MGEQMKSAEERYSDMQNVINREANCYGRGSVVNQLILEEVIRELYEIRAILESKDDDRTHHFTWENK